MKQFFAYLILSIVFLQNAKSQDSLKPTVVQVPTYYKAKIYMLEGQIAKGRLLAINDSSISILERNTNKSGLTNPDPFHKAHFTGDSTRDKKYYTTNHYHYKSIKSVVVTNKKLKSWIIVSGMVVGIVVGAIIGGNNGDDPNGWFAASSGEKAVFGGILGAGLGAVPGAIVSSAAEKKYMIDGEWKSFEQLKASMRH
jgi:hypothetical protein